MADPVSAIRFAHPATSPSTILFFRPGEKGIIFVQKVTEPIQWVEEAITGESTVKQLSGNQKVTWEASFAYMEATEALVGISGFTALQTFFSATVNYAEQTFVVTDKDNTSITCRLVPGSFRWRRGESGIQDFYFFGSFSLLKIL